MQEIFRAIQRASTSATWSRGVELARAQAVTGEHADPDEIVLRVATRGSLIELIVTLCPADEEWECTCKEPEDPCQHVAAAAIALRQARKAGRDLPAPSAPHGKIRYRFSTEGSELTFEREIETEGQPHRLASSLDALAKGRVSGPKFTATQQDILVEHALGSRARGALPRDVMLKLLRSLAGNAEVRVDGTPVEVVDEPIVPHGRIVDAPGGVRLYVEADSTITKVFTNGAVLCGDRLRPVGESRLTGREREDLPRGRFYANDQLAELVTEVLPDLETRIPIEIATQRLPATSETETPQILLAVSRRGEDLSILPTLVYGSPPVARVDAGRLIHLNGPIPVRDESEERARVRQLQRALNLIPGRRVQLSGDEAIDFAQRLSAWPGRIKGNAHLSFYKRPELLPRVSLDDDRFDLKFEVPAGTREEEAPGAGSAERGGASGRTTPEGASSEAVLRAWFQGSSLVPLRDGGFAPLPADWLARFGHRVADLLAARSEDGSVPTCALPDLGRLCEDLDEAPPARLDQLRPILEDFSGIEEAPLPEDLTHPLRHYQQRGVDWLCFLRRAKLGALLADDMGLGKTLQALCAIEGRCLVVAPTSVLHNWIDEMRRFRPQLSYSLYHGPRRELDADAQVILTSYAILRLDANLLTSERWCAVVLDEAQNIKNPESQVAAAAFELQADWRIALTGTPVENRLEELWSQFHFLNRGLLGGRKSFQERYAGPIAEGDPVAAERLRERIHPFILRRLKKDVAPELPPRTEVVLHCELSEEERQVYDTVRAASLADVVEKLRTGGGVMAALEALLRLRQAACHPSLVPGQTAEDSTKLQLLGERLEQAMADSHRALVFSQWTSLLDLVGAKLRSSDIPFERLDGSTRDRGAVVRRFQDAEGAPVMLVSLKAGGTGLNLTAADHIFLLDPWWNPAVEDQAADRAHRIGQNKPVVVHRIVALDTVEERILELHARKRALSDVALSGIGAGEGLSRDDLLSLLDEG